MTLRKLINEVGMCEKDLKKLKKLKDFKVIKNLDIVTSDDITNWDLLEYFDSNRFSKDITAVVEMIPEFKSFYSKFNLEPNNFFLYITSTKPLKLKISPLIG